MYTGKIVQNLLITWLECMIKSLNIPYVLPHRLIFIGLITLWDYVFILASSELSVSEKRNATNCVVLNFLLN